MHYIQKICASCFFVDIRKIYSKSKFIIIRQSAKHMILSFYDKPSKTVGKKRGEYDEQELFI